MVTTLSGLFANSEQPSHDDKESAVQQLVSILEQAQAIGHAHASSELGRAVHSWGGNFQNSLNSAWAIVNTFAQRIADWFGQQHEAGDDDVKTEAEALAKRVAGYEVAAAIEEEVVNTLVAQGISKLKSVAQDGACDDCQAKADADPVPASQFVPPPYHTECRCSSAGADEEE